MEAKDERIQQQQIDMEAKDEQMQKGSIYLLDHLEIVYLAITMQ